jgi:predicted TIM-barrel fold metal-dependent hydrolase
MDYAQAVRIDIHVHLCAVSMPAGAMSRKLFNSVPFRFMRWRLNLDATDPHLQQSLERVLLQALDQTPELDAIALLAFDAVHRRDGSIDWPRTHLYVHNDYVFDLAKRFPKILPVASIHPYRRDAIAELERCVKAGAVMIKWLPIVQDFNPSDPLCIPFYEAMAHHGIPLLSHTGAENALPNLDKTTADPMLLRPALERGVKVVMAHCGSKLYPWELDYSDNFIRLANEFEHCYGDTSALNVPGRWYALTKCLRDPVARTKLVHGSDWPILPIPPATTIGWEKARDLMREPNWIRRDVLIKQQFAELDQDYWTRAAKVLKLS